MTGVLIAQGLLPAGLLLWLGAGRAESRLGWGMRGALVTACLSFISFAGLWLALPRAVLWVWWAILPIAGLAGFLRGVTPPLPRRRPGPLVGVVILAGLTAAAGAAAARAWLGRRPPDLAAVELELPLRGGLYYVANGGRAPLLNAHLAIPERARERYRGQMHAVDVVRVDGYGRRSAGVRPEDPTAWAIFGDTVRAPCSGRVVLAEDGLPDMRPPAIDPEHLAGNHIILACGVATRSARNDRSARGSGDRDRREVWVVLAHLVRGSVRVAAGQHVRVGEPVGRVGNSGRSSEPHLHIHAQSPGTLANPMGAEPLAVRFGGRYLARNDRISG